MMDSLYHVIDDDALHDSQHDAIKFDVHDLIRDISVLAKFIFLPDEYDGDR